MCFLLQIIRKGLTKSSAFFQSRAAFHGPHHVSVAVSSAMHHRCTYSCFHSGENVIYIRLGETLFAFISKVARCHPFGCAFFFFFFPGTRVNNHTPVAPLHLRQSQWDSPLSYDERSAIVEPWIIQLLCEAPAGSKVKVRIWISEALLAVWGGGGGGLFLS